MRQLSKTFYVSGSNNGRNANALLNGAIVGSYLYNAFEQRVQKTAGPTVTQFVFDRFGHLLEEANASGVAQKEYIWLDDLPVAVIDDTGTSPVLYYIHTDQLGTPQKITDASAVIVWDGVFDPFGNPQYLTGAGIWDTSKWDNFTWDADLSLTNLRFPGQYADAETSLNQNWFRDYDPSIGRYIQSDPIGLRAGSNTYSYAEANPLRKWDPNGQIVPVAIAACLLDPVCVTLAAVTAYETGQILEQAADTIRQLAKTKNCPAEDQCDYQYYNVDIPTCRAISRRRGKRAAARCYASAAERYGACIAGRPIPPLDTWSN